MIDNQYTTSEGQSIDVLYVIDEHEVSGLVNVLCYQNEHLDNIDGVNLNYSAIHLSEEVRRYISKQDMDVDILQGISDYKRPFFEAVDAVQSIQKFLKVVDRIDPDIIHAHAFPASILVAISAHFRPNIPIIYTQHVIRHNSNLIENALFKQIFDRYNYITCVTDSVKDSWTKEFPQTEDRVKTIYNGISTQYFKPTQSAEESKKLIMISRLVEGRRFEPLIRGFSEVADPEIKLEIVGTGPRMPELQEIAKEVDEQDRISFCGFVDDIRPKLDSGDLFLFPTGSFEGFGMSIIEAMSMKMPVIAINHPVLEEVISDGYNGCLVDPSPHAVSSAIEDTINDDEKLSRMSRNARRTVENNFSISTMSEQYMELYSKCFN